MPGDTVQFMLFALILVDIYNSAIVKTSAVIFIVAFEVYITPFIQVLADRLCKKKLTIRIAFALMLGITYFLYYFSSS